MQLSKLGFEGTIQPTCTNCTYVGIYLFLETMYTLTVLNTITSWKSAKMARQQLIMPFCLRTTEFDVLCQLPSCWSNIFHMSETHIRIFMVFALHHFVKCSFATELHLINRGTIPHIKLHRSPTNSG